MTRAHDEAVEAAARVRAAEEYERPWEQLSPEKRGWCLRQVGEVIRAYHAHRRATDGAVLVVVPGDKPFSMGDGVYATERRVGHNAALAAVRASAEEVP